VQWTVVGTTVALGFAGLTWIADATTHGTPPRGDFEPRRLDVWTLTGADGEMIRRDTLRRALFELDSSDAITPTPALAVPSDGPLTCRFLVAPPSGTSAKFDCVLDGGEVVKVKYGRNPEIQAETAASSLLPMLGYAADRVTIVPRLRCHGCPRFPFLAATLAHRFSLPLLRDATAEGYTDFEWVSVERKFPAQPIETDARKGWAWWELEASAAPRADVDALRLTAIFLAHWDNKSENQRLVCLDTPPPTADAQCVRPLAMLQDLGATFGPTKVNLAQWRALPIWKDRRHCTVSMKALPFHGATFPDAQITEAARARLAARLAAIDDGTLEQLFRNARFPQFQVGTDDSEDVKAWVEAFRHRADQIASARCPAGPEAFRLHAPTA
jgi:hypothetical protein